MAGCTSAPTVVSETEEAMVCECESGSKVFGQVEMDGGADLKSSEVLGADRR